MAHLHCLGCIKKVINVSTWCALGMWPHITQATDLKMHALILVHASSLMNSLKLPLLPAVVQYLLITTCFQLLEFAETKCYQPHPRGSAGSWKEVEERTMNMFTIFSTWCFDLQHPLQDSSFPASHKRYDEKRKDVNMRLQYGRCISTGNGNGFKDLFCVWARGEPHVYSAIHIDKHSSHNSLQSIMQHKLKKKYRQQHVYEGNLIPDKIRFFRIISLTCHRR